jgi:hypothetical protein
MEGHKRGRLPKGVAVRLDLTEAERSEVASLIREHLRTTRNLLSPSLEPLKSAYAKLAPGDEPPPRPRLKQQPLGLRQGSRSPFGHR